MQSKFYMCSLILLARSDLLFSVQLKIADYAVNNPDLTLGLFCHNPANPCIKKQGIKATLLASGSQKSSAEAATNSTAQAEPIEYVKTIDEILSATYKSNFDEKNYWSIGLTRLKFTSLTQRKERQQSDFKEEGNLQTLHLSTGFKILENLTGGFSYKVLSLEQKILGSFRFTRGEVTVIKGTLHGFGFGFSYDVLPFKIDAFYNSPFSGKANVEGEHRLYTLRGFSGTHLFYFLNNHSSVGLIAGKWLYRPDQIFSRGIDPSGGTNIFLSGLDIENHIFDRTLLGLTYFASFNPLTLKSTIQLIDSTALFADSYSDEELQDDDATKLTFYKVGANAAYAINHQISLDLSLNYTKSQKSYDLTDSENTYGFRQYRKYQSSSSLVTLGIHYTL